MVSLEHDGDEHSRTRPLEEVDGIPATLEMAGVVDRMVLLEAAHHPALAHAVLNCFLHESLGAGGMGLAAPGRGKGAVLPPPPVAVSDVAGPHAAGLTQEDVQGIMQLLIEAAVTELRRLERGGN